MSECMYDNCSHDHKADDDPRTNEQQMIDGDRLPVPPRAATRTDNDPGPLWLDGEQEAASQAEPCGCECHGKYEWAICSHCRPDILRSKIKENRGM